MGVGQNTLPFTDELSGSSDAIKTFVSLYQKNKTKSSPFLSRNSVIGCFKGQVWEICMSVMFPDNIRVTVNPSVKSGVGVFGWVCFCSTKHQTTNAQPAQMLVYSTC